MQSKSVPYHSNCFVLSHCSTTPVTNSGPRPSVHQSVSRLRSSACLSVCLSVCACLPFFVHRSVCLRVRFPRLSVCLSVQPSIFGCLGLSSACPSVRSSVGLSVGLFTHLFPCFTDWSKSSPINQQSYYRTDCCLSASTSDLLSSRIIIEY